MVKFCWIQAVAKVDTLQTVTASPMNGCNILFDSHRTVVPGKRRVHLSASHHHSASVLTTAPTFLFSTSQTGTHLVSAKLPNPSHLFPAPTCSAGNPQCSEQRKLGSDCQTCTAWKLFESQPSTHTTVWKSLVETQQLTF